MKIVPLETKRLILRPFTIQDVDGVFEFASNVLAQQFTGNPVITNKEQALGLIKNVWLKDYETQGYGRYAVIHKAENKIIGYNGVKFLEELQVTD